MELAHATPRWIEPTGLETWLLLPVDGDTELCLELSQMETRELVCKMTMDVA